MNVNLISNLLVLMIVNCCFSGVAHALQISQPVTDFQFRNINSDDQGYLSNTTNDGHLILGDLNLTRDQMCGILLSIEFKVTPLRATLFDVYWRTAKTDFSENQKGFFFINQDDARKPSKYLLPLCKLFNFSGNLHNASLQNNITGFRLDFPPNKDVVLRIQSIDFLNAQGMVNVVNENSDIVTTEVYERIQARSFMTLDVIIPKLIFAFEEGLQRLYKDVPFLMVWLLIIFLLKLLLLGSFIRQIKTNDDK